MKNKIGTMLRGMRIESGLTQREVGKRLGYTTAQFISNWERGVALPPAKKVRKLAKVYKCKPQVIAEPVAKQLHDDYIRGV